MGQESLLIMAKGQLASPPNRRWSIEQRIEFIELRAFWNGFLNRSDISEQFSVSTPQASSDIATYMERAPGNLSYDAKSKRYEATTGFVPRISTPSAESYLADLERASTGIREEPSTSQIRFPSLAVTPLLERTIDPLVLREITNQIRASRSIEIEYNSMSPRHPDPMWRQITPHSLASDGLRWHVRAYCHSDKRFKDFLLSRIRATGKAEEASISIGQDEDWNTIVAVRLVPNPELSKAQKDAVSWDYNMGPTGSLELRIRRALLYYFSRRLRLDVATDRPGERPVVMASQEAFDLELAAAQGRVSG